MSAQQKAEFVRPNYLSEKYSIPVSTIYHWISTGKMAARKVNGRLIIPTSEEIRVFGSNEAGQ
jgi:hypothetical protein